MFINNNQSDQTATRNKWERNLCQTSLQLHVDQLAKLSYLCISQRDRTGAL